MHCMFPQPSAWGWRLGFVPTRAQQVPPTSLARFLFCGCDCEGRKELHGHSFLNRTSVYITERTSIVSVSFSWENSQVVVKRTILWKEEERAMAGPLPLGWPAVGAAVLCICGLSVPGQRRETAPHRTLLPRPLPAES